MRTTFAIAAVAAFSGLTSCGEGGGGAGTPAITGRILVRDGVSTNLSGVILTCPESGSTDVSTATGRFALDVPRGTPFHLDVDDPTASGKGDGLASDCTESDDVTPDAGDIAGKDVEIEGIEDGESCEVEIEIEDGEIVGVHVTKDGGEKEYGEGVLLPPTKGDGYGEVEAGAEGGCLRLEVEARGLPTGTFTVLLVGADRAEQPLGTLTLGENGKEGHLVFEACAEGGLPLGAATPADLLGATIEVRNADGSVVLSGAFPEPGVSKAKEDEEPKDRKDDDRPVEKD